MPASLCCLSGNLRTAVRSQFGGSRFAAFQSTRSSLAIVRMALRFADGILSFANGNIEYLLRKLSDVTRTFGHEPSMPQIGSYFETETLPVTLLITSAAS